MDYSVEIRKLQKQIQDLKEQRTIGLKFKDNIIAVMRATGHGMWQWSKENDLLLFDNNGSFWVDDLGYSPGEYCNNMKWWLKNLHPRSRQDWINALNMYLSGEKEFFELECRMKTKAGCWAWFWARGIGTSFDKNGTLENMLGIYSNTTDKKEAEIQLIQQNEGLEKRINERTQQLTDANQVLKDEIERRKRTEEKLEWAKQQAETANQAKTQFLANISHELRTPLHHILSFSKFGIKRSKEPKERLIRYFSQIQKSSRRLKILVDDLLDVASLELGKVVYSFQTIDVYRLISEAVVEMEPIYQNKNINLLIATPTIPTVLTCDERRIEQVIFNLISNAIQYSPEGSSITVAFDEERLVDNFSPKPAFKVSVTDQGVGIPDIELGTIFDSFVQGSRTMTGAGGTGLGLSICKRIIGDHHGKIWAANNREGGAVFSFLLPYEQKAV